MKKSAFLILSSTAFLFSCASSINAQQTQPPVQKDYQSQYELLNLFGGVLERVKSDYVEEVKDEDLIHSAIQGMLTSLDPHSTYLTTKDFQDMQVQTKGEFGGLGIEVTMEQGLVKVVSPIDDTPAARAGIMPGDLISKIDDELVTGLTLQQAVEKMRGKPGTQIKIEVLREGNIEPLEFTLTRDIIKIISARHEIKDNVGYVRITSFSEKTFEGVEKAVAEIKKEKGDDLAGYVIDMRNNPGGLLDQAIKIADAFLDEGEIVSTRSRNPQDANRYQAIKGDISDGKPIVVLINGGSASASEIVAGALQDHKRAVLMGTKSFGKGSVQTVIPIHGHGAIRMTTSKYYTPSGRSIQALGIEPDIIVEQAKLEEIKSNNQRSEADLRGSLRNEQVNGDNSAKNNQPPKAGSDEDYQLARAIDLVRGIAIFGK